MITAELLEARLERLLMPMSDGQYRKLSAEDRGRREEICDLLDILNEAPRPFTEDEETGQPGDEA